jgi:hypothetical protein
MLKGVDDAGADEEMALVTSDHAATIEDRTY